MSFSAPRERASSPPESKQKPQTHDGDSVYVRDSQFVQQAVKKIQELAAAMRREASQASMPTSNNSGKRIQRLDVQEAVREAKTIYDDANRRLQGFSLSGDLPMSEQQLRRLTQQKLKDGLMASIKQLEAARMQCEAAEAERAKAAAAAAADPSGAGGGSAVQMAALGSAADVEAANRKMMMAEVSEAEEEFHAAIVDEFVGEVNTLHRDVRVLQQCMVDLAEHTQTQGSQLDNIEFQMQSARDATAGGASEVLLAARHHRTGTRWMYWLLLLVVIAVVILTILIIRAQNR
eukprot:gnl/TRDRNA2_/TRDRNA2_190268_c0_seq1.p1 gnl/TRDRNA2_/TRDRNA2_190268_c0~~gnl/TRDRNA2_/TRDRNA2_190268_c0_seq1.p1  ORF type:complete len:291 (+),score=79.34 gnl/TRDRNA2_/TRDRNA2_190268_c0_seq1:61-933(+)